MGLPETVAAIRSSVLHIEFVVSGQRVASGSGFVAGGCLVTNNHVFAGPQNATVILRHQPDAGGQPHEIATLPISSFASSLVSGSDRNNFDFAILQLEAIQKAGIPDLRFGDPGTLRVGQPIAFLGFPFDHTNLVCHSGVISSFFRSGPVEVIQLDASVNQSNSGGPLFDPENGLVVGIVTRKGTGLSGLFDQLIQVFDQNIAALSSSQAVIRVGGVDPIEMAIVGQNQMKALAAEIQRSANVGIGYAFSIERVAADPAFSPYHRDPEP